MTNINKSNKKRQITYKMDNTAPTKQRFAKISILLFAFCLLYSSCCDQTEVYRSEVLGAEQAFAKMAQDSGVQAAFLAFAAEDAVLLRNNKLIEGKHELEEYFDNPAWENIQLEWKPDFIDVAESGDLAYTYGKFTLTQIDSTGSPVKSNGIFHTVWKRQDDGTLKFVWD